MVPCASMPIGVRVVSKVRARALTVLGLRMCVISWLAWWARMVVACSAARFRAARYQLSPPCGALLRPDAAARAPTTPGFAHEPGARDHRACGWRRWRVAGRAFSRG